MLRVYDEKVLFLSRRVPAMVGTTVSRYFVFECASGLSGLRQAKSQCAHSRLLGRMSQMGRIFKILADIPSSTSSQSQAAELPRARLASSASQYQPIEAPGESQFS